VEVHRREVVREAAAHTLRDREKLHQAAVPEPAARTQQDRTVQLLAAEPEPEDRSPQVREMQLQEAAREAAHTPQDQEKLHQEVKGHTQQDRAAQVLAAQLLAVRGRSASG